jgi:hypothetical protein
MFPFFPQGVNNSCPILLAKLLTWKPGGKIERISDV